MLPHDSIDGTLHYEFLCLWRLIRSQGWATTVHSNDRVIRVANGDAGPLPTTLGQVRLSPSRSQMRWARACELHRERNSNCRR